MMKKTVAALALAASVALSACSQEKTQVAEQAASGLNLEKTYIVATDATYAPMEYMENNQVVGFSYEILDTAAKTQGVKLEFVNTPFEGIFANVNKGDSDIALASITINEERSQTLDFSDPYFEATQMIVTTDRVQDIKAFEDLKDRTASVQSATSADLILQELQGKESSNIKRFDTMPLAFKELESGGVDAAVGDSSVVAYYVQQNPNMQLTTLVDPSFEKEEYGFAFKKGRDDGLREAINAGLAQIKADGTYQELYNKWFGSESK